MTERHICAWHKENDKKEEAGELIIDGNLIEFYSRFHGEVFPASFIGGDGIRGYKVFVNGSARPSERKSLEYSSSHRVFYVLMQNFQFSQGLEISGIKEFSFEIPELINWLGIKTVSYVSSEEGNFGAIELDMDTIVLKQSKPSIKIELESKSFNESIEENDNVKITIKNVPRIYVSYDEPKDVSVIVDDIECLMQFFELLVGKVSTADDIRLSIQGQELKSWLYINRDLSYNLRTQDILDKPRTYYYVLADKIEHYYESWRLFYFDDTYELLRRIYFAANHQKELFAEEIFVEYMRFLDGYHTRICGDEEKKKKIKDSLKNATDAIKTLLFTDEGKALFEDAMLEADPSWKCNSNHIKEISGWIAAGYLGKTQLSYRLKELDSMFFSIISNNAVDVEKHTKDKGRYENKSEEALIQIYFKELGDTRNYYSHYKLDTSGVLEMQQIIDSIPVLKSTIVAILLSHMGLEKELIRRIIEFDNELQWKTMFLRKESEHPFLHPSQMEDVDMS